VVTVRLAVLGTDIAFLAYLTGPRAGSIAYNAVHTTLCPAALVGLAVILGDASLATVWGQSGPHISDTTGWAAGA